MRILLVISALAASSPAYADGYLGQLSANRFDPQSVSNPYGAGNPAAPDGINNPFGRYGNPASPQSVTNPFTTTAPKLYDSQGNYRGRLSANPYDPESVANPFGRYGSRFSPDSINNPFGAGNPYAPDSPTNPFGRGLGIFADDPFHDDPFDAGHPPPPGPGFGVPWPAGPEAGHVPAGNWLTPTPEG